MIEKLPTKYIAERSAIADDFNLTWDEVEAILGSLPYSCIPELGDVREVLEQVLNCKSITRSKGQS